MSAIPGHNNQELIDFLSEGSQTDSQKEQRYHDFCTQVDNILSSYDDQFDAFSELLQNSFDALLHRWQSGDEEFKPLIKVLVDYDQNTLSVLDNGCGVAEKDFRDVMRPNRSIKRKYGHKTARGEKGAGVVFLQFGHDAFEFHTKYDAYQQSYVISGGRSWFKRTSQLLASPENSFSEKGFEKANYQLNSSLSPYLEIIDRGSFTKIKFGPICKIDQLSTVFGHQQEFALNRLEYILRTRTAIGYILDDGEESKFVKRIKVEIEIKSEDGKIWNKNIETGFLYPHEIAKRAKGFGPSSYMTDPRNGSELFHDEITSGLVGKYTAFESFWSRQKYKRQFDDFDVSGYFSYAYKNTYYEEISSKFLFGTRDLDESEVVSLIEDLVQVNAGFQIAVKNYPNGRRQNFLQRGGSEQKSRTFVVLNFRQNYKPDYGRKNLAYEARGFVNDLCKALIKFATTENRRDYLATSKKSAVRGARDQREAKILLETEKEQYFLGESLLVKSGTNLQRLPRSEDEVIAAFLNYLTTGRLPGFGIYGLPGNTQLDSLFDYSLPNSQADKWEFDPESNSLGVFFREGDDILYFRHWMEFKVSCDKLVEDFKKSPDVRGRKYFSTIDLLVCADVDDSFDDYSLEFIESEDRARERLYYGVTHLLSCNNNTDHVIQVISLKQLFEILPLG